MSIRGRLTLWYVAVMAAILFVYAVSASILLRRNLHAQLVRFAVQDLETVEGLLYFDAAGVIQFHDNYHNHPESKLIQERMLEVRSLSGDILYRNDRLGNQALDGPTQPGEGEGTYSAREVLLSSGIRVQLVSRRHTMDEQPLLLRVAYSLEPLNDQFRAELLAMLLPLPFILAATGGGAYYLARRALRPIREMSRQAESITGDRLHARLPVTQADELGHLSRIFNGMFERLEQSFSQLRRFTADASHELRTPLTLIQSVGEVGLQTNTTPAQYRDTIGSMLEESNRLTRLVENLLIISKADAGQISPEYKVFRAIDLARECAGLLDVLIEEKLQKLVVRGDEEAIVSGDWLLLEQALLNVLHNAIKHTPQGGSIALIVRHTHSSVILDVEDSGPGLSAEDRARVFDRFYRVENGRSQTQGGTGLGLSIAQWTVRAHSGEISVETNASLGCTFSIKLPSRPPADAPRL
ncbi:MAG: ATP-binding protein [Acidobacteriota bacterium]